MERRAVLATAGPALLGVISGCQSNTGASPPPEDVRLIDLRYRNRDQQSYRLNVLLVEDGEPVYWTVKDVVPAETQDDGSLLIQARTFEGYPIEPAPYVLYARLEASPPSDWHTTDFEGLGSVSGDPEYLCVETEIEIVDSQLNLENDFEVPDSDDTVKSKPLGIEN